MQQGPKTKVPYIFQHIDQDKSKGEGEEGHFIPQSHLTSSICP